MRLWLVRHAQPLVAAGVCYGASDLPADEAATQACAAQLAPQLPPGVALITSPLQRCERLAQQIQGLRPDLMLKRDARLAEMDFGCWEGQRWDSIPQSAFDAWTTDFGAHPFGGRESVNQLLQRVAAVRAETLQQGGDAVWVTHAGVIRAMALLAQGIERLEHAEQWPRHAPGFGEWHQQPL
ncbi:histidine phosphatase family protein [Curvibacter delicatus]|jgi:alpha-ribazole phosphatase|uniref:histidine phosphatase family protein n=1 Tax=Curvibacter delicatus TaxID=80879 RepID=UPI000833561A|nr:histidine phosphatase family protein [Curvibacter delicatus]